MSNEIILWSSIILPWFTLIFMRKEEVKRFMPVALFGALITTMFSELALALHFWNIKESIFPFYHVAPMAYGAFPVGILWIFKLTDKRFLLFMVANLVFDFTLTFILDPWLIRRGIIEFVNTTSFQLLIMNLVLASVLYGYQMWQEDVFIAPEKMNFSRRSKIAVAKPMRTEEGDENRGS